jgi:hypothetical protein
VDIEIEGLLVRWFHSTLHIIIFALKLLLANKRPPIVSVVVLLLLNHSTTHSLRITLPRPFNFTRTGVERARSQDQKAQVGSTFDASIKTLADPSSAYPKSLVDIFRPGI